MRARFIFNKSAFIAHSECTSIYADGMRAHCICIDTQLNSYKRPHHQASSCPAQPLPSPPHSASPDYFDEDKAGQSSCCPKGTHDRIEPRLPNSFFPMTVAVVHYSFDGIPSFVRSRVSAFNPLIQHPSTERLILGSEAEVRCRASAHCLPPSPPSTSGLIPGTSFCVPPAYCLQECGNF